MVKGKLRVPTHSLDCTMADLAPMAVMNLPSTSCSVYTLRCRRSRAVSEACKRFEDESLDMYMYMLKLNVTKAILSLALQNPRAY